MATEKRTTGGDEKQPHTAHPGAINPPVISARFLVPVFRYLHRHHPQEARRYLQKHQLDENQFESEDTITMACFQTILEDAARDCGDPNIGLHIYEALDFNNLGILGYALTSADTVGSALALHFRYYHLYQSAVELSCEIHGDRVHQSYRILAPGLEYSRQDSEISMMYTVYLIQRLAKADWHPQEAHFQHAEPDDISEHQRLLCQKIYFNQPTNRLVFDKRTLELPITNANAHLSNTMEEALRRIDRLHDDSEDALLEKIQYEIVSSLPEVLPSMEDIANRLHLGPRTLQRRLAEQGYKFSQLLDITRQQLAIHYLVDTSILATDIAFLLGYSESSAFDRAFKRWTQMKPLEYRARYTKR